MAMRTQEITVGVDISKGWFDAAVDDSQAVERVPNEAKAIERWLGRFTAPVQLALEPTGGYHEALARLAHAAGHRVYLVDPFRLSRYRGATGRRAKTDKIDAQLLRRYLEKEGPELRPWQPVSAGAYRLWQLLKRRTVVVKAQVQLRQSFDGVADLKKAVASSLAPMTLLLKEIDRRLQEEAEALGWSDQLRRLRKVPSVGPLTAVALVAAYDRGTFSSADQFVAFLGLDVRVRDSGKSRGKRKLTKKGEPELRRLLYLAAMSASRTPRWQGYYRQLRERGLSSTAAFVALSRKLVRLAYALLRDGTSYEPERRRTCAQP